MVSRAAIDDFLAQEALAVVGASTSGRKFGNSAFEVLKKSGRRVFIVNPKAKEIGGEPSYPSLQELPQKVGGVVVVVPPAQTEGLVRQVKAAGIERVWMQPGAESELAISFCQENGISVISHECVMMHAEPVRGFHRFHRGVRKVLGRMPR